MDQEIKTVIQYPVGATEFDIPFDYLSRKFVRVSLVADDNRRLLSNITEYRYVSKTRVKILVETTGFNRVEIRRFTSASERIVDFSDGSVLRATDLNVSQIQSAHIAEESRDAALMAMPQDDAGNLDARNRRIVRLAPGVDGSDAVNKNQLDTTLGEAGGILSEVKAEKQDFYEYLEKFADDTAMLRGVVWVYNSGSATGGETSVVINKPTQVYSVPYIEINGDRQEIGYQYDFDVTTQRITLAKPLVAGDFLMAMTTESKIPLESLLAGTKGASSIGTSDGSTVQESLDGIRKEVEAIRGSNSPATAFPEVDIRGGNGTYTLEKYVSKYNLVPNKIPKCTVSYTGTTVTIETWIPWSDNPGGGGCGSFAQFNIRVAGSSRTVRAMGRFGWKTVVADVNVEEYGGADKVTLSLSKSQAGNVQLIVDNAPIGGSITGWIKEL